MQLRYVLLDPDDIVLGVVADPGEHKPGPGQYVYAVHDGRSVVIGEPLPDAEPHPDQATFDL